MLTFAEARDAVRPEAEKNWHAGMGTLVIASAGFEDASFWMVRAVAQEELDGDSSFTQMDEIVYLVNKETGNVIPTTYLARQQQIDDMAPYPA